jgi:hypothetical protein
MGNTIQRQSSSGTSGYWFTFLTVGFLVVVGIYIILLTVLGLSTSSVNQCAAKARSSFLTNSTLTDDCQAEAAGGDTSCVSDFYKEIRWRKKEWYFIHLPLPLGILVFFSIVIFLQFPAVRVLWWAAAIWMTILGVCIAVCVGWMLLYTVQCNQHDFCVRLKKAFDITTFVHKGTPDAWWLTHVIAAGLLCIDLCFVFGMSLFLEQAGAWATMALGYAQPNRQAD